MVETGVFWLATRTFSEHEVCLEHDASALCTVAHDGRTPLDLVVDHYMNSLVPWQPRARDEKLGRDSVAFLQGDPAETIEYNL